MNSSRNLYSHGNDFAELAKTDDDFAKYFKPGKRFDFKNPDAVRQLTRSLLKRDFKLDVELPIDRLCPPVPNRLNYILWIQDLLDETDTEFKEGYDSEKRVRGLDIGTGASCIYPLLGCSIRPGWEFVATELDKKNYEYALHNVKLNDLQSCITPVKKETVDSLLGGFSGNFDFVMCNPPFYASEDELLHLASSKSRPPFSACTGAPIEMIYSPGGELSFITRIITESQLPENRAKIQWFTVMCGRFETVDRVLEMLKNKECTNTAVREFVNQQEGDNDDDDDYQNERKGIRRKNTGTKRWGVAWSWMALRPGMETSRNNVTSKIPKHLLPFPSEYTFAYKAPSFPQTVDPHEHGLDKKRVKHDNEDVSVPVHSTTSSPLQQFLTTLRAAMEPLQMRWRWDLNSARACGVGWSNGDVWSRKARRARNKQSASSGVYEESLTPQDAGFGVRIEGFIVSGERDKGGVISNDLDVSAAGEKRKLDEEEWKQCPVEKVEVKVRWLKGADEVLFESFCGMVKRKVEHGTAKMR